MLTSAELQELRQMRRGPAEPDHRAGRREQLGQVDARRPNRGRRIRCPAVWQPEHAIPADPVRRTHGCAESRNGTNGAGCPGRSKGRKRSARRGGSAASSRSASSCPHFFCRPNKPRSGTRSWRWTTMAASVGGQKTRPLMTSSSKMRIEMAAAPAASRHVCRKPGGRPAGTASWCRCKRLRPGGPRSIPPSAAHRGEGRSGGPGRPPPARRPRGLGSFATRSPRTSMANSFERTFKTTWSGLLVPERPQLVDRGPGLKERPRLEAAPVQPAFLRVREEPGFFEHPDVLGDRGDAHVEVARTQLPTTWLTTPLRARRGGPGGGRAPWRPPALQ